MLIQSQSRELPPGLPKGAESQGFTLSFTAFLGHRQGAEWKVELPELEMVPIWDPGVFQARTLTIMLWCWVQEKFTSYIGNAKTILESRIKNLFILSNDHKCFKIIYEL